jgi:SAM-dependent methyltransferase
MRTDLTKRYYETSAYDYYRATYNVDLTPLWEKMERDLKPSALILDLGCGSGRDLLHFSHKGYRVVGIDYSLPLLRLANTLSHQPIIQGDLAYLPFNHNVFDAGWAIGSLLHIARRLISSVLSDIHRILKPDACLLTSVKKGTGKGIDSLGRYTEFYLLKEWEEMLKTNGFEVVEIEEKPETGVVKVGDRREVVWINCLAKKRAY